MLPIEPDNELLKYLEQFITPERDKKMDEVLDFRTDYITVVLEDIYQPHNASAVIRTCDCFGIQNLHIIENRNRYKINPDVSLGSHKWVTLQKHNKNKQNTTAAISNLRKEGYRIVATSPHKDSCSVDDFKLETGKIVLLFGTERTGLSQTALDLADEFIKIPMHGFTESFNISVSAAIILHHLTEKLRKSEIPWQLNEKSRLKLKFEWVRKSIKKADLIIHKYLETRGLKQRE